MRAEATIMTYTAMATLLLAPGALHAQVEADPVARASDAPGDIVVTARRRE